MVDYYLVLCALVYVASGCTSGFIELDLLQRRAEKIDNNGNIGSNGLDDEFRLLFGESFSGSGTMTGLLLVGTVRTGGGRDEYPEIQLWRNTTANTYTRLARQEIRLNPGDFSPDGVLQYNLITPISFQSGDVLGVYQPDLGDSIVRVYYDSNNASTTYRSGRNPTSPITIQTSLSSGNELILISPISVVSSCTANFLSRSALRQGALNVNINNAIKFSSRQRLFPDITFTCNGSITKWIVGGTTDNTGPLQPELQIWRSTGETSYTKTKFTSLPFSIPINNVAEYTLCTPLEFQEGDILGVYQPQQSDSALVVYSQERDGPANFETEERIETLSSVIGNPGGFDYPLVTVEIKTASANSTTMTTKLPVTSSVKMPRSTTSACISNNNLQQFILQSSTFTSFSLKAVTSTVNPSPESSPQENIIVFIVVALVLLVLFITIATVTIAMMVIICRRKNNPHINPKHPKLDEEELQLNECYMRPVMGTCINQQNQDADGDDYDEINENQDDNIIVLQQNEAYSTQIQPQQNEAYSTQVQLQPNVCYATTSATANDRKQMINDFIPGNDSNSPSVPLQQPTADLIPLQQNECYVASKSIIDECNNEYSYADSGFQTQHTCMVCASDATTSSSHQSCEKL